MERIRYRLKSEVAVLANALHYCMFVSKHTIGSMHDYQHHKNIYSTYVPYLFKLPDEHEHLPGDIKNRFWAVVADMGYIGPATDTLDERRIVPKKGKVKPHKFNVNHEIKIVCMPVEQYFGHS
jgi:hypothetical protein